MPRDPDALSKLNQAVRLRHFVIWNRRGADEKIIAEELADGGHNNDVETCVGVSDRAAFWRRMLTDMERNRQRNMAEGQKCCEEA